MKKKSYRIFIGLREFTYYCKYLKQGFEELGMQAVYVDLGGQPFNYQIDENNPKWINIINRTSQKIASFSNSNIFLRIIWVGILQNFISFFLFFWAVFKFDIFIFTSNSTFFFFLDYPILKFLKKKIIHVSHGSDSRPAYSNGKIKSIKSAVILAKIQKIIISIIEKYSDVLINEPSRGLFYTKPFAIFSIIGLPFTENKINKKTNFLKKSNEGANILHVASIPEKGTYKIRKIIKSLKEKNYHIDYIEITGRPNSEVLLEIQKCDFVINELYADNLSNYFFAESSFFGKPTVTAGYYFKQIKNDIPKKYIPPVLFCHPDKISQNIEKMIIDKKFREELGRKAQKFVKNHWDPKSVAEKYLKIINGDISQDWLYNPQKIRYIHGWGISEENLKERIRKIIKMGGIKALQLSDKPKLEKLFSKLITI